MYALLAFWLQFSRTKGELGYFPKVFLGSFSFSRYGGRNGRSYAISRMMVPLRTCNKPFHLSKTCKFIYISNMLIKQGQKLLNSIPKHIYNEKLCLFSKTLCILCTIEVMPLLYFTNVHTYKYPLSDFL